LQHCSTANMTFTATSYCTHSVSDKTWHRAEGIPIRRSESKLPAAYAAIFTVAFTAIQNKLSIFLQLGFQKEYLVHPLSWSRPSNTFKVTVKGHLTVVVCRIRWTRHFFPLACADLRARSPRYYSKTGRKRNQE